MASSSDPRELTPEEREALIAQLRPPRQALSRREQSQFQAARLAVFEQRDVHEAEGKTLPPYDECHIFFKAGLAAARASSPAPDTDGKIQMYNLGGEYLDLPTRLLAWPDLCAAVEEARRAGEAAAVASSPVPEGRCRTCGGSQRVTDPDLIGDVEPGADWMPCPVCVPVEDAEIQAAMGTISADDVPDELLRHQIAGRAVRAARDARISFAAPVSVGDEDEPITIRVDASAFKKNREEMER